MTFSAQDWSAQEQALLDVKSDFVARMSSVEQCISRLDVIITGFERVPFQARCAAGHCAHDGYFHITQGWNPSAGTFVPSHYRTKDLIVAERAVEPTGMVPVIFNEAASFNGRIYRGPGLDTLPAVLNDDLTTDAMYSSATGSSPWAPETGVPPVPYECGGMIAHDNYLYSFLGVRYTGHDSPTYVMPQQAWRKPANGAWEQRSSTLPKRRSFAYVSWHGRIIVIGGADDNFNGQDYRKVYGDILRSNDGLQTLVNVGEGPFGPAYGRRAAQFSGHVVLVGGAAGDGSFSSPITYTNKVWASNHSDLTPNSWFEIAPLPIPLMHAAVGSLVIEGVETLAVIGGYNHLTHAVGGPVGRIYTLDSLTGSWVARTDSDFWTEAIP